MKARIRICAALLALSMLCSLGTPALAAGTPEPAETKTGSISATLRMDYPQSLEEIQQRKIQVEVKQGSNSLGKVDLGTPGAATLGGYPLNVTHRNSNGATAVGVEIPAYLELSLGQLPQGRYTLRVTGTGYQTYEQQITLQDYSQHLIFGTEDAFALGDVNADGKVDEADRTALSAALGSTAQKDVAQYDLDGDGRIDIVDLSYLSRVLDAERGEGTVLNTALIDPPVDPNALHDGLNGVGFEGDLNNLFLENGETVKLGPAAGDIVLPINLTTPQELESVQILFPETEAPANGMITVEDKDGNHTQFPFDNTAIPEDVYTLSPIEGQKVVTINLGRRVAVKKIIVTVTPTETGYVSVTSIQFLKDIVPENPVAPNSEIKNLKAAPGDELVNLTWNPLPNVSGYRVHYWPQDGKTTAQELNVATAAATVSGLENLTTYVFTVTPTDGTWTGKVSQPVTAIPEPSKAPKAPDMVTIGELEGALSVSWKQAENATYYEVYYQEKGASDWTQAGGRLEITSTTLSPLTNGTTYCVYVVAGNTIGKSGPSRIYEGTPKEVDYSRPEGIPTEGMLDNSEIASIELADKNNYNSTFYPEGFDPQNMIDGDYKTHWTASNSWNRNEHVVVTFKNPVDLCAAFWVPRLDGAYPTYLRAYSVRVWTADDPDGPGTLLVPNPDRGGLDNGGTGSDVHTWPTIPNQTSIPTQRFAFLPFDPVEDIVKISIATEQVGYGGHPVSLSELMFQTYDPAHCLPNDIAALFGDELHTQLAADVNQTVIDTLRTRLAEEKNYYPYLYEVMADELTLAEELLSGRSSGVLLSGIESRSGSAAGNSGQGGSDLQPLGVMSMAKKEITIYASGIPAGGKVHVYATQYNAEVSAWKALVGTLENGRNTLYIPQIGSQNTPRGGSLYLTYSGVDADKINLHIRRATAIPTLNLSQWYSMDETARQTAIGTYIDTLDTYLGSLTINTENQATEVRNVTEIGTPTVLLSLPAAAVKGGLGTGDRDARVTALYQDIEAWEDIMHICKITQGIDDTYETSKMEVRQNIRCMQMFAGAFMYAAGNHVGIGYGSCSGMVAGRPIRMLGADATANSLFGWGIAHEIGHNMDKLGKAEITNNIYSIMVQTYDGKDNTLKSRLELSGKYAKIFTKVAQQYPGASNDVFVQLGMYWQLHLAYDEGQGMAHGPLWFYNAFFKKWKAGDYSGKPYDDRVALIASEVAGKNLTEFFTRWGMVLSKETTMALSDTSKFAQESRAIWYLNDQSRRDRLAGGTGATGTLAVTAAKKQTVNGSGVTQTSKNEITLTITPTITGNIQGYEIRRIENGDSRSIDFIAASADGKPVEYTDVIGSGNHRTYQYEVAAYDTLGNLISTAQSGEIRIAYEMTVDPSAYDLTRADDGTITITMKEETPVSGLWLTGDPGSLFTETELKVDIAMDQGESHEAKIVTAKSIELTEDNSQPLDNPTANKDDFLTYFHKPGAEGTDTRIWTYDAKTITITGVPAGAEVQLIRYAGDNVEFSADATVGILKEDYKYGDGAQDVIKAGTLIITGAYRGDPIFNYFKIKGKFTETTDAGDTKEVERDIAGEGLMFAEIPADGAVSDISDGFFVFIPNIELEQELQKDPNSEQDPQSKCDGVHTLPSQMKVEFYRTDKPNETAGGRMTADTLWINTPGGTQQDLPLIELKNDPQIQEQPQEETP